MLCIVLTHEELYVKNWSKYQLSHSLGCHSLQESIGKLFSHQKSGNKKGKLLPKKLRCLQMKSINKLKEPWKLNWYVWKRIIVYGHTIKRHHVHSHFCESRNISIKFPSALLVYLCLSSRDLFIFSVRVSTFYSYFYVIHTSILSFSSNYFLNKVFKVIES